jgi:amidase
VEKPVEKEFSMTELCDLEAVELRQHIGDKEISPVELLESCIARIDRINGTVNSVCATDFDTARKLAKKAEQDVMNGEYLGLLHGLPVGIKDLEATRGLRTTWGSLIHERDIPEADTLAVANIRDEGALIFAKTNTPEFGAGANTKNKVYGTTGNPFNPELSCAGSSGGSAVSLATGMMPLATGSDFGGSLRTPASFCGIVGFRPSPGVVPSEDKTTALAPWSVLGPMARTVADAYLLLQAQMDVDLRDPFSKSLDDALLEPLQKIDLGSTRVAISEDLGCAPVDNDIRTIFRDRTSIFRSVFAEAENRDPDLGPVHDVFEILRGVSFVADHLDHLENHRNLLGPNIIDNTERGLEFTARDIAWAQSQQTQIYQRYLAMFEEIDVLICPAAAVSPYPHVNLSVDEINGEKMPTYMRWLAIVYGHTMAIPAVCVIPCGVDHLGMPFGIQIVGPNGSDKLVLEIAHTLEGIFKKQEKLRRPIPDLTQLSR